MPGYRFLCVVVAMGALAVSPLVDENWNRDVLSVDAHPFQDRDGRKILVVFRTSSGLFETKLSADLSFSPPRHIPITGSAADEFSNAIRSRGAGSRARG